MQTFSHDQPGPHRRPGLSRSIPREPGPAEDATKYIQGPKMFCPFGTLAQKAGRLSLLRIPTLLQPNGEPLAWQAGFLPALKDESTIQLFAQNGLKTLHEKRADAVLFVEAGPPHTHQEGMLRAWTFWAELMVAGKVLGGDTTSQVFLRSTAVERASRGARPENIIEFFDHSNIFLRDEQYVVTAINPCYGEEGGSRPGVRHPRYFPVSAYLLTPFAELARVRESQSRLAIDIAIRITTDAKYPYLAGLPYVIPNDSRFLIPEFAQVIKVAEQLQKISPGKLRGDPLEIARSTFLYLQKKMNDGAEGAAALRAGSEFNPEQIWREMGLYSA